MKIIIHATRIFKTLTLLQPQAFYSGRFRIPEKVKTPSPEKPPESSAWQLMAMLTPEQRQRVRAKLLGTVDCVIPFEMGTTTDKKSGEEENEQT